MFKRIEKRRRKKEEEEDLGLDEDMKEVLGLHDTDSDESESDSDQSVADDDPEGKDDSPSIEETDSGASEADDNSDSEPMITVKEALRDPIYLVSLQPDVKACIVCPGKLLKGSKMVELHCKSNAHDRRSRQFSRLAKDASLNENAWDVLRQGSDTKPKQLLQPAENSKRAEKKKAKAAAFKARREKKKAKAAAKKAREVTSGADDVSPSKGIKVIIIEESGRETAATKSPSGKVPLSDKPPTKKRKTSLSKTPTMDKTPAPAPPQKSIAATTITSIARLTADRAKKARSRATNISTSKKITA
ncbi:hypothetical protein BD779DRAFT_587819 [Infundibulicybe gibba]|nr:hypothetical protein BD779DRAFT_587819 [Infundibulicybe gibba]